MHKIQSDVMARVEVVALIKKVAMRTSSFNTNSVVVLVELDSERSAHMALKRSGRLKGSGLYLRQVARGRKRDRELRTYHTTRVKEKCSYGSV